MAPAASAVTMFGISRFWLRRYSLMLIINSVLSGLVGITASCAVIEPWAAVVVGVVAALAYTASSRLLVRLHIDDPLDAAAVHAASGFWGLLTSVAAQARAEGGGEALPGEHNTPHGPPHLASPHSPGLFATPTGIKESFGLSSVLHYGLLVGVRCGQHSFPPPPPAQPYMPPLPRNAQGGWEHLGLQVIGALCITAWTLVTSSIVFALLHKANALRVDPDTEMAGATPRTPLPLAPLPGTDRPPLGRPGHAEARDPSICRIPADPRVNAITLWPLLECDVDAAAGVDLDPLLALAVLGRLRVCLPARRHRSTARGQLQAREAAGLLRVGAATAAPVALGEWGTRVSAGLCLPPPPPGPAAAQLTSSVLYAQG